ncbi:DUF2254 domain-containing protein [Virgibacillus kekensis]|uniref:DUF2254 domain-containing protein n=1 Tax=Virgibacillus kekensis TaxID=202261 RepID=A0ABV9DMQ6_9BACI
MKSTKTWIGIRDNFWLVPAIYGIIAIVSVVGLNALDSWLIAAYTKEIPQLLLTSQETAKSLYASLVTAILTMTTISFSVIMVVLTTYSMQFSPRTLQDFMRSRVTHHVLGVFSFGFIFALTYLLLSGENRTILGPIMMTMVAICCLGFFIYFIHHSARLVQVNQLIKKIHADGNQVISHAFRGREFNEHETWEGKDIEQIKEQSGYELTANGPGYIQSINWKPLVKWAKEKDIAVELKIQTGDYVFKDVPVAKIVGTDSETASKKLHNHIVIGNERTDIQDVEFLLEKLVEIAVMAISPAKNDPHTASNSINRIGSLLARLGKEYREARYLSDKDGELRVIARPKRYEDYLYKSFYQIKHYNNDDVSIYFSMIEVLYKVALVSEETIQRKIWDFHHYIIEAIDWESLQKTDREYLQEIYDKFLSIYDS